MKERLDQLLATRGLASDKNHAAALIMAGRVYVDNQKTDKVGEYCKTDSIIEVRGDTLKYVSRGGLKLEKALGVFPLSLDGCVCCDFGASTGGFTDCMLQNGASKVYAFDVGYGQLAWRLRQDSRVVNYERTNVRHLTGDEVAEPIDFISIDVSFISLSLILPVAHKLLRDGGAVVCLIKPQFEAPREKVGKKGVVTEQSVHNAVILKIIDCSQRFGFNVKGLAFSPIKGPEGNIEYLLYLIKEKAEPFSIDLIKNIIGDAHDALRVSDEP